ncbi:hypothetical protein QQS21_012396 [Conoideocrella luteorostrata]|uniref:Uncharacterized protein n=1 Tax=Conoideocrella luteorostrata TaxID=1105319 RepID=A0AAJ0CE38_9HYPO|nr:hypothetical protein QQS21_012396 [Conoideocrella luteorostrata]
MNTVETRPASDLLLGAPTSRRAGLSSIAISLTGKPRHAVLRGPVSPSIFGNLPKYGSDRLGKLSDHENHDSPTESIRICYVDTEDVSRNAHKPFHISPVPTTQEGAVYETNKIKDPLLLNKALPPYPNPKKNKHTALDQSGLKEREPVRQLTARRLKPSNWSMLNKVAEVISLRHFQRVQADEIITAQQLEETRLKRLDSQRKESSERENLIGITGSASSRLIVNSPKKLRKKPRKNARSFSLSSDKLSACKAIPAASTIMGDTVEFQQSQQIHNKDILSHPELLSKDTTRHRLQKNNGECLTNLEFKITERDKQVNRPNKDWRIARGDNELNVCTLSRSFSSSKPSFRLSSITCQQQNAYGKESTERDDNEEFAFGSAYWITTSGFEDNLVSPQCKYDENEHAHDVLQWFGTFGFGSHDQLIKDEIPSEKDSLAGTIMSTSPSTINSDVGIPIPMEPKLHNRDKSSDLVRFFRSEMRPRKNPRRRGLE